MISKLELNRQTYGIGEVAKTELNEVKTTADEALDTANQALDKANKAEPKREGMVGVFESGWWGIFDFPATLTSTVFQIILCKNRKHEASEAASFLISYSYDNVKGREKVIINQLADVSYLPMITKVRVILHDGALYFQFYYNANVSADIYFFVKPFSADTGDFTIRISHNTVLLPSDIVFEYDVIGNTGIVADRALADINGNNLEKYIFSAHVNKNIFQVLTWSEFDVGSFIFSVERKGNGNSSESMNFFISVNTSSDSSLEKASVTQLNSTSSSGLIDNITFYIKGGTLYMTFEYTFSNPDDFTISFFNISGYKIKNCHPEFTMYTGTLPSDSIIYTINKYKAGLVADYAVKDGVGNNIAEQFSKLNSHVFINPTDFSQITRQSIVVFNDGFEHTDVTHLICSAIIITNDSSVTFREGNVCYADFLYVHGTLNTYRLKINYAYCEQANITTTTADDDCVIDTMFLFLSTINSNSLVLGDVFSYGYDGLTNTIICARHEGKLRYSGALTAHITTNLALVTCIYDPSSNYTVSGKYRFITLDGDITGTGLNTVSALSIEDEPEEIIPAYEGAEEEFRNEFLSHVPYTVSQYMK